MSTPPPDETTQDDFLGESLLHTASLRDHAVRGFAWNSLWRWSLRGLSIVSTASLARLLTPYDFGLFAMAMIVVNFIEVFTQTGHLLALIRMENPTREHFDTAWTLQVLIGLGLGAIIILVAPLAPRYFGVPEVETLLYFISLRTMIGGFANVGVITFRINLDYAKECRLGVLQKALYVALCIGLAVVIGNYWALAIGVVGGNVILVALTFMMHNYRPRFTLVKLREIWSFSFWVLVGFVSDYTGRRLDEVVVGGLVAPTQMGFYTAASDSASMAISDLMDPIARALFPIYARFVDDRERLLAGFLNTLSVAAVVAFSTSVGLALVARDFIHVLLGQQWDATANVLQWLALAGIGMGLVHGVGTILTATNRLGLAVFVVWVRIAVVLPCLIIAGHYFGLIGVAITQTAVMISMVPIWYFVLARVIPLTVSQILARLWRPILACIAMAVVVGGIRMIMPVPSALRLAVLVFAGAATYFLSQMALWMCAGRPDGVEEISGTLLRRVIRNHIPVWSRPER